MCTGRWSEVRVADMWTCPKLWKNSPCVHVVYQVLRENLVTNANDRRPGEICRAGHISFGLKINKSLWRNKNNFESNWILWLTPGQETSPPAIELWSHDSLKSFRLASKGLEHYCVCVCVSVCLFIAVWQWLVRVPFQWQRGQNDVVCLLFFTFNDGDDNNTLHSISVHSNQLKHLFCLTQSLPLMFFSFVVCNPMSHIYSFVLKYVCYTLMLCS